jgi:hypothetical protein
MAVHSCDVPGCNAPAQWQCLTGFVAAKFTYLCTPHWKDSRGGSWSRLPVRPVVQSGIVLPDPEVEEAEPEPAMIGEEPIV